MSLMAARCSVVSVFGVVGSCSVVEPDSCSAAVVGSCSVGAAECCFAVVVDSCSAEEVDRYLVGQEADNCSVGEADNCWLEVDGAI